MTTKIPLRFETRHATTLAGMRDFYLARDGFLAEQMKRRGKGTPIGTYKAPDGSPVEVWLARKDLRKHTLVLGATGTGKSTLLERIAQFHLEDRTGFALLDPHGDLFHRVANHALGRRRNLAIVDFTQPEFLPSWNPLIPMPDVEAPRQVELVLSVLKRLYPDEVAQSWAWGVKVHEILAWTLRALVEANAAGRPASLVEVPSFLLIPHCRDLYLEAASEQTRDYFETRFGAREEMYCSAAINKLEPFLSSIAVQRFLGAPKSSLDLFRLLDEGGTLLVNLSKGYLPNADVVGRLLMNAMQLAVLRRDRVQPDARVPFSIILDEAQNLASAESGLEDLLVSARKYKVSITVAAQELGLFPARLRTHILGNTGVQYFFRLPFSDAQTLARDIFEPTGTLLRQPVRPYDPLDDPMLKPHEEIAARTRDLANLPRGVCYVHHAGTRYKARRVELHPRQALPYAPGTYARRLQAHMRARQLRVERNADLGTPELLA